MWLEGGTDAYAYIRIHPASLDASFLYSFMTPRHPRLTFPLEAVKMSPGRYALSEIMFSQAATITCTSTPGRWQHSSTVGGGRTRWVGGWRDWIGW